MVVSGSSGVGSPHVGCRGVVRSGSSGVVSLVGCCRGVVGGLVVVEGGSSREVGVVCVGGRGEVVVVVAPVIVGVAGAGSGN